MQFLQQHRIFSYLIFLGLVMLAYWQIAFLKYSIQYDLLDVVLPWRYFVTECFMNGEWPLWNPYQQCGYPIYADPQYPIFTPEVLLIASTIGYSNITLHFLLVFYISIAGMSMYKLTLFLLENKTAAIFSGIIYCLSGFFTGHASSLTLIIAGAWLPLVLYYFLKLRQTLHWKEVIKLSFAGLLMASSGYQAITFILIYLLLTFVLYFAVDAYKNKELKFFFKWNQLLVLSAAIILLCMLPILVGVFDAIPYITRLGEISAENLVKGSFTLQSFWSFLLPFATVDNDFNLGTDISMANIYVGILPLCLFVYSFFIPQKTELKILAWFGLFCFLTAIGNELPFRLWVSKLPLMATFRFPSIFRLFTVLGISLMAAHAFIQLKNNKFLQQKIYFFSALIMLGIFINLLIIFSKSDLFFWFLKAENYKELIVQSSLSQRILLQSLVQIALFIIFSTTFFLVTKYRQSIFLLWVIIDLILAVQMCIWGTGINSGNPSEIYSHLEKKPKGFPLPVLKPLYKTTDYSAAFYPLWHNTNIFEKRISCDCMTSFVFKDYELLFNEHKTLSDSITHNPFIYLSDNILPLSSLSKNETYASNTVFIEDAKANELKDTKVFKGDAIKLVSFSPNKWELISYTKGEALLCLLQSHYKNFNCFVNGKQQEIHKTNLLFSSVVIKPGVHKIVFEYENNFFKYSAYFSFSMLILLLYFFYRSLFQSSVQPLSSNPNSIALNEQR